MSRIFTINVATHLIETTRKEYGKLARLIESLDQATAMKKREGDTSIKDVIAHWAYWIGLFLGWYWDDWQGKTVCFPVEGHNWNDLKRYNADLRNRQSDMGWSVAVELLNRNC